MAGITLKIKNLSQFSSKLNMQSKNVNRNITTPKKETKHVTIDEELVRGGLSTKEMISNFRKEIITKDIDNDNESSNRKVVARTISWRLKKRALSMDTSEPTQ